MTDYVDIDALWQVAALSVSFAVGVVGLYSIGVAAISAPEGTRAGPARRGLALVCFAVCIAIIAFGVWVMLDK